MKEIVIANLKIGNAQSELINPEIELSTETKKGKTTIYVKATISGDDTILSITLPDGKIVNSDTAEFETEEPGEYEFTVTTNNGVVASKTITIEDLDEVSADNPYIPDGFTHVSDTDIETGFVIEDESGNQFVWVPVESGRLKRNTENDSSYEEIDSTASGLYNSVAKYYGFYIARYEASQAKYNNTDTVGSVADVMPWSNINYSECYDIATEAANVYGYVGVKTALVNSYAWDTTLDWINETEKNYSSNTSYGNYSGTILKTGETSTDEVNSICDMAGNLREWTTEVYYQEDVLNENNVNTVSEEENADETTNNTSNTVNDEDLTYRVIRGGSANINKVANSHIGQLETMSDSYWGFRIILYKD